MGNLTHKKSLNPVGGEGSENKQCNWPNKSVYNKNKNRYKQEQDSGESSWAQHNDKFINPTLLH